MCKENCEPKSIIHNRKTENISLKQYSIINSVGIKGIPEVKNKDYENTASKPMYVLSINVNDSDIDATHKVGNFWSKKKKSIILKSISQSQSKETVPEKRQK